MSALEWHKPLVFAGGAVLPNRVIPGPMEGVTEGSFIELFTALELVDAWFTPFIRISSGVPRVGRLRGRLEPFLKAGLPLVAQILGTERDLLVETAVRLHGIGVVCVDLNCACPSPQVVRSGGGGLLLRNPGWIKDTLAAMKKACGGRAVSVKLRCGYGSADELEEIGAAVRESGVDWVTCHFRTVGEMYSPVAGGNGRLARMREKLGRLPMFGSGDLFTVEDAMRMREEAGVDGVAPARGLMRNPLLIRQILAYSRGEECRAELTSEEKLAFLGKIGALSGMTRRHQGFVLKIASIMFGRDSHEFRGLLESFR